MIKVNENKKPSVKLIKHYIKDLSFENPITKILYLTNGMKRND